MLKYLLSLWVVFGCFMLSPAMALELGEITVGSEAQQILDAKVALHDIASENLSDWYVITVDQDEYQARDLQYIRGLHDRLVMEIVTSASRPYIAVSSIASMSRNFDLIVHIGNGKENRRKVYRVVLKKPPAPIVEVTRAMAPAEILNYLTHALADVQNISEVEAWGKLKSLTAGAHQGSGQKLISSIASADLSLSFIIGISAMLNEQQKVIFNRIKAETGNARAVAAALFGQQDFLILKVLFKQAAEHTLEEGATKSKQLDFEKERVAILKNKLYELKYAKIQQDLAALQRVSKPLLEPKYIKDIDWQDYQSWLDYLDWGKKPLLSNAKVWIIVAVFLGFLLLLLSIRLFLGQKTQPVKSAFGTGRIRAPLPGQSDLEKLRTPRVYINPLDKASENQKDQDDEITGKLNRAEAYIEMGEHEEARRLLKGLEKQSQGPQQLARMRKLRDKMR